MKRKKEIVAVITADMVNSTLFPTEQTAEWLNELILEIRNCPIFNWSLAPEIYRGDSFQAVMKNPEEALRMAILARMMMRSNAGKADLRIAIGIGGVDLITDRPGTSDGEAFRLSGRLADQMREKKAKIAFAFPLPAPAAEATMDLLETLIEGWTTAQCEVIKELLLGQNITQIAEKFSISQSAVSQRVASAKWWAIETLPMKFSENFAQYLKP